MSTLNACQCCNGNVLLWQNNSSAGRLSFVKGVYEKMGLICHDSTNWTEDIHDYGLIIWPTANSDPPWWNDVYSFTWEGRLVFTAEHSGFPESCDYVNDKSAVIGMSVTPALHDAGCQWNGTVEIDDLTEGLSIIMYALTSEIDGGTTLSNTRGTPLPWLAHNKPEGSPTDFVLAGDSNFIADDCGVAITNNVRLFQNFWNVPL